MSRMRTKCIICGLNLYGWKEVGDDKIKFPRAKRTIGKECISNGKHGYAHINCIEKVKKI